MAKKRAKTRNQKRKIQKVSQKSKAQKKNPTGMIVAVAAVFLVLIAAMAIIGGNGSNQQNFMPMPNGNQNIAPPVVHDACQTNSQCFITYCKGQEKRCVNTTSFSSYSKNCQSYSDWVMETQDASECACIDSVCKMLK
jgi:hypothetical protein